MFSTSPLSLAYEKKKPTINPISQNTIISRRHIKLSLLPSSFPFSCVFGVDLGLSKLQPYFAFLSWNGEVEEVFKC